MLEFNVATLLRSPVGTTRQYAIDDILEVECSEIKVRGETTFIKTNRSVLVKGDFNTEVPANCCRCLNQFIYPMRFGFTEEFFPSIDLTSGLPTRAGEDQQDFVIDARHILSLAEPIRQYIILNMPMKPLCRADCAGIVVKQNKK